MKISGRDRQLHSFLQETTVTLRTIIGKYGDDHMAVKLIEDLQEESLEWFNKFGRSSKMQIAEYFSRQRDRVQDVIQDYKL